MGRLFPLLFLVQIVLAVIALISCISAEDGELRGLPKLAWVVVILLFPLIGSIVYFIAGRPVTTTPRPGVWRMGGGFPEADRARRPLAPDDDPDFLRSLRERREDTPKDKPKDDLPEG
jgi:hypothetical protein